MASYPDLELPARMIPVPSSISEAAQGLLAAMSSFPTTPYPELSDRKGWDKRVERAETMMLQFMGSMTEKLEGVSAQACDLGGVPAFRLKPEIGANEGGVVLDIHGGGLTNGGGELCKITGMMAASALNALTYAVDYRMPPAHPYPAPLNDCIAAYRALLKLYPAEKVIVRGTSAGGNLAAAMILRARDEGLALPLAVVLGTPEVDLTESGDSFRTNAGIDVVLKGSLMPANLLYAAGHDLADPYLSPLFGDFSKGFPPTIITTGTRDLFLSNSVRMHNALRRAGNRSELIVEEAMPHGGFLGAPEDALVAADVRDFAERAWRGEFGRRSSQT